MGKYDAAIRELMVPGRTQKEIALTLGISQATVSYVINGIKPTRSAAAKERRAIEQKNESEVNKFTYTWRPRPITVPAPNALPWVTRERLMAGR